MAEIVLHSFIFILTSLFVSSICLDIHWGENPQVSPNINNRQNTQPIQQVQYGYPYGYHPGMYYQGSASNEAYNHQQNYHRSQFQQNYGKMMRRSSPSFGVRQTTCPLAHHHENEQQEVYRCYRSAPTPSPVLNFPLYPICNGHNYPTANYDQREGLVPFGGRDSRSVLGSQKMQSGNDSPTLTYLSNNLMKSNDTKDKRAAQNPPITFYERPNMRKNSTGVKQTIAPDTIVTVTIKPPPSNPHSSVIVAPSRKYYNPTLITNTSRSDRVLQVNGNPAIYTLQQPPNPMTNAYGQIDNTNMQTSSARSYGSNDGKIYYPVDYSVRPTYAGPIQQGMSIYRNSMASSPYKPYNYLSTARSANSIQWPTSSVSTNDHKLYPVYTPNLVRNTM